MRCATCQSEVQPGQKFCPECGTRLEGACTECGAILPPGAKFCAECGAATGAGADPAGVPAAVSAPIAERRVVSVLFADLVGFTALAEGRDPEETRDLLGRYFDLARERIERYGGTVEKFIGDAVMAVWGAPQAFEDDAERAVRAALDLVADVTRLGTTELPVSARAAVLTGEAAVTVGARGQGMVAGDIVNTASRLQAVAEPGSVLVGESTLKASAAAIAYESVGDHALKGKALPVAAWRALRVVGRRGGQGRSEGLEAPFVGRDDELAILKDLYHSTVRERRARIVSITGQAGIGKSRLAWELLKYLDGLSEVLRWQQGRSPAFGEGVSFWALGEMVRGRAGILEDEGPEATADKLRSMLREYVPDADERIRLEPALRSLLGLEDPGLERGELFGAWRTLFERVAETGTAAVLVFEDLQWADMGLVDFIEELATRSRNHPILVITLARPEFLERRPTWGAGQRNFTSLHLEPLGTEAMATLLEGLVPGLPTSTRKAILGRAEGVPLYAVEIVRMLVAEGSLVREDDRYRVARPLDRLSVPDSLHALVAARLDALGAQDRALLQDAAVLGQSFTLAAIASLTADGDVDLRARLDDLVDREWLVVEADDLSPERGQYQFVQGVIREVAYATLAKRDRRSRHLAAARYFEALDDAELPALLATHYLAAYQSTSPGPDADPLAAQARVSLRAAADRAASLGSPEQALGYLREAIAMTDDRLERADLEERAGIAATDAGRYDEAFAPLETAVATFFDAGDLARAARALARVSAAYHLSGRTQEAIARLEPEIDRVGTADDGGHAWLFAELARGYMLDWRPDDEILAACDKALDIAERLDLLPVIADVLITKGTALSKSHARQGAALLVGALQLAESIDDVRIQLRAINNIGTVLEDDVPSRWGELSGRGAALARRVGNSELEVGFEGTVAWMRFYSGDPRGSLAELDELEREGLTPYARAQLDTGRELLLTILGDRETAAEVRRSIDADYESFSHHEFRAWRTGNQAYLALMDGRIEDALPLAEEFRGTDVDLFYADLMIARCAFRVGDVERARAAVTGVEAAPRKGRAVDARRSALRAALHAMEGEAAFALRGFDEAFGVFRELGLLFDLACHQLDMAAVLRGTPACRAVAAEARAAFESMGAVSLVAQIDKIMSADHVSASELTPSVGATTASEVV
ncbi:MAG TPA: adenylate/guanylate cyclase domain-containing protein [Candidatus Limnocylindrales bacterium]